MTNVLEVSSSLNLNTHLSITMDSNSGRSIHSGEGERVTFKHNTRTSLECMSEDE